MRTRVGGRWSRALLGLALAATLSGGAREASACSPPPQGWFPSGVFPTPANGVVFLRYGCYSSCETAPDLENLRLETEAGETVPGSVVFTERLGDNLSVGFLPEPGAVTEGRSYGAVLDGVPRLNGILVGPAVTWHDALSPSENLFEVDYPTGEQQCCAGPIDSCGNTPCFREQVERRTAVFVSIADELSSERYQYVFRLDREVIDGDAPWVWDSGSVRFELAPEEDGACYVLELKRLVDDSVQTFSRCVEQPETFVPGLHGTREEEIYAVLEACDAPPDGYEALWCEARAPLCETSPDEPWCEGFAARCEMVGAGGAAGASSGAGSGGDTTGGGTTGINGGAGASGGKTGAGGGTSAGGSAQAGGTTQAVGTTQAGGTTHAASGTGATAEGGAPDGNAGDAGEPSGSRRVYTKGCGCSVPGESPRAPALLSLTVVVAAALRRSSRTRRATEAA